jgi:uncharacterized protein (DUF1697 family)
MTVYVALLRGVNVGGRGKVDMRELRRQFEKLGCSDVSTYINSGNVIFRDRRAASTLTHELEKVLGRRVAVGALVRHYFNLRHRGLNVWPLLGVAAAAIVAIALIIR